MLTLNFPMSNIMSFLYVYFIFSLRRVTEKEIGWFWQIFVFRLISSQNSLIFRIAEVKRAISLIQRLFYTVRFFSSLKNVFDLTTIRLCFDWN